MSTVKTQASFAFRTDKATGEKRPTVELEIQVPSKEGIVELLNSAEASDKATQELVMEAIAGIITPHIRTYIEDDKNFNQQAYDELFADGKLDLQYIANMPRAERSVLSKEDLEAFAADYVQLMPGISGKDVARVQLTAQLVVERFKRCAGDPDVIRVVKANLIQFTENAPEDVVITHGRVLTWAFNKLEGMETIQISADAL